MRPTSDGESLSFPSRTLLLPSGTRRGSEAHGPPQSQRSHFPASSPPSLGSHLCAGWPPDGQGAEPGKEHHFLECDPQKPSQETGRKGVLRLSVSSSVAVPWMLPGQRGDLQPVQAQKATHVSASYRRQLCNPQIPGRKLRTRGRSSHKRARESVCSFQIFFFQWMQPEICIHSWSPSGVSPGLSSQCT